LHVDVAVRSGIHSKEKASGLHKNFLLFQVYFQIGREKRCPRRDRKSFVSRCRNLREGRGPCLCISLRLLIVSMAYVISYWALVAEDRERVKSKMNSKCVAHLFDAKKKKRQRTKKKKAVEQQETPSAPGFNPLCSGWLTRAFGFPFHF